MVEPSRPPRVVCLCGSMRFETSMQYAAAYESLLGNVVVMPHVNMRRGDVGVWCEVTKSNPDEVKSGLDRLHKQKIDMADSVLVVTDDAGYVGESTRSEIAYARALGKPVDYWYAEPAAGGDAS